MILRETYWKVGSVIGFVFMITSCAAVPPPDEIEPKKYFNEGTDIRKASKGKAPQLGLALAGGGTKAGDFSIGVLQGLTEAGIMDQVDAVSTVSGGGYAALWYFARLLNGDDSERSDSPKLSQQKIAQTFFADCLPFVYVAYLGSSIENEQEPRWAGPCPKNEYTNFSKMEKAFEHDEVRFQNYLRGYQDVMAWIQPFDYRVTPSDYFVNATEITGLALLSAAATVVQLLPNVVFDWEMPISPTRETYRAGILRAFGAATPNCFKDGSACQDGERRSGQLDWVQAQMKFSLLRQEYEKGNIPLWIINATAGEDRVPWSVGQKAFRFTSFEFSPYGSGSHLFGYSRHSLGELLPWQAALASAAFLDSQQRVFNPKLNSTANVLMRTFTFDWGHSIPNNRVSWWKHAFHKILPWPLYLGHGRSGNSADNHVKIRLSDGGQSENLGAYALIQRNLPIMILSDHSADRSGRMGDLCRLKNGLENESGDKGRLYVIVPGLKKLEQVCAEEDIGYDIFKWQHPILLGCITSNSKDANCSGVKGSDRHHFQKIFIIKPAIPDSNAKLEIGKALARKSLVKIRSKCENKAQGGKECVETLREVCFQLPAGKPYLPPVMGFPVSENPWRYESHISCELLGFMINNALIKETSDDGTSEYVSNKEGTNKNDGCPYFPQSSTVDITTNSSPFLYGAYRELGRYYARQLGWFFGGESEHRPLNDATMQSRYDSVLAYQWKHPMEPAPIFGPDEKAGVSGACLL